MNCHHWIEKNKSLIQVIAVQTFHQAAFGQVLEDTCCNCMTFFPFFVICLLASRDFCIRNTQFLGIVGRSMSFLFFYWCCGPWLVSRHVFLSFSFSGPDGRHANFFMLLNFIIMALEALKNLSLSLPFSFVQPGCSMLSRPIMSCSSMFWCCQHLLMRKPETMPRSCSVSLSPHFYVSDFTDSTDSIDLINSLGKPHNIFLFVGKKGTASWYTLKI